MTPMNCRRLPLPRITRRLKLASPHGYSNLTPVNPAAAYALAMRIHNIDVDR
jgi:hypothetical protein